ncbi:MAG: methylated-DNA--[protein]-cysteine S-methyltransferase [Exilispira sp.]
MVKKKIDKYHLTIYSLDTEIGRLYCYFSRKGLFQMLLDEDLSISKDKKACIKVFKLNEVEKEMQKLCEINYQILKYELTGYFNKEKIKFTVPLDMSFYSEFQLKVLNQLLQIPYGSVNSYKQIAESIGNPKASRAVGNAVGSNRTLIIIPCHRVIKFDGNAGWFGGKGVGTELKKRLLLYEGLKLN